MSVKLDDGAKMAVEAILKRGNDAIIRRKGNNVVVLEEKRKTVYNPLPDRR